MPDDLESSGRPVIEKVTRAKGELLLGRGFSVWGHQKRKVDKARAVSYYQATRLD